MDAAIVNSVSDATGILKETTTVISEAPAKTPSNERTRLDQLPTADPEAESPFTNSFISDIGFFGGATDSLRGENLVATVIDPSVSPSIDSASTGAIGLAVSGTTKTSPGEKSLPPLPIMKTAVMFPSPVSLTRSRLMQRTASPA